MFTSRHVLFFALLGATCAVGGCAAPAGSSPTGAKTGRGPAAATDRKLNLPAGVTRSVQVVAGLLPLGTVPYDNLVLPLVSPDGRYLATQTGAPPTWPTALAEPGAEVPAATHLEVYELDRRDGIEQKDRKQPELVSSVSEPALLGRCCDDEGFLIESPRSDGSRWIGKAAWRSGEISWLVESTEVNAFAALGSGGRLAWSRRTIDAEHFELVVRSGGKEWSVSTPLEDWLLPTWSGRGDGLFVLNLNNTTLEVRYAIASSEAAVRQSMQRLSLTGNAKFYTAYQTINGQSDAGLQAAQPRDQLVFFHPGLGRMALWRPLAASDKQRIHLNARSIAALVDQEDYTFVGTSERLLRQSLRNPEEQMELVPGPQVPRATTSATWPYLLLTPGESRIGVTAMRLVPSEESVFTPRKAAR